MRGMRAGWFLLLFLTAPGVARAELVEDIVAWVNGEIITLSDYKEEEKNQVAEAYRRLSGEELDRWTREVKTGILLDMIDRKILVHHAKSLGYDLNKLGASMLESFKAQQNVKSEEEFKEMIAQEGLTVEAVTERLIEMYAPQEVINFEVKNRVAISDREVEKYYESHPESFQKVGEVTIREIVLLAGTADEKRERRAEAEAILGRLAEGADFAEVATESSEAGTKSAGGLLGTLGRKDLSSELAEAAFRVPVGGISEVMETPYGLHILKVEARTDDQMQTLDEVRERLRLFLEDRALREKLAEFMVRMRDNSEWCVKPKYQDLLSIPAPKDCSTL